MERPTREVLIAIIRLVEHETETWKVIRGWLQSSLKQALEIPDNGVARGMALQLVDLMDIVDEARESLRELEKSQK